MDWHQIKKSIIVETVNHLLFGSKCEGKGDHMKCLEPAHDLCCVLNSTRWCCYCTFEVWVPQHKVQSPDVTKYFSLNKGGCINTHRTEGDVSTNE